MRYRVAAVAAAIAAVITSVAAMAMAAGPVSVSDDFDSGGYGGSNSTAGGGWAAPWSEIGEDDGPAAGSVVVKKASGCDSNCLVVSGSILLLGSGASRTAEVASPSNAELAYSANFDALTTAVLTVQVNPDGGGWKTIAIRRGSGTYVDSIGSVASSVGVRFSVAGLGIGGSTSVDDVDLTFVPAPTTTTSLGLPIPPITLPSLTTTTTVPQNPTTPTTQPANTTTTRPSTTTTTSARSQETVRAAGGVPLPPDDGPTSSAPTSDASGGVEPTRDDGVVMHLDPGLMPSFMLSDDDVQVVDGLSVPFGMRAENLSLDLTLYIILGLTLAAVSALRFELGSNK